MGIARIHERLVNGIWTRPREHNPVNPAQRGLKRPAGPYDRDPCPLPARNLPGNRARPGPPAAAGRASAARLSADFGARQVAVFGSVLTP